MRCDRNNAGLSMVSRQLTYLKSRGRSLKWPARGLCVGRIERQFRGELITARGKGTRRTQTPRMPRSAAAEVHAARGLLGNPVVEATRVRIPMTQQCVRSRRPSHRKSSRSNVCLLVGNHRAGAQLCSRKKLLRGLQKIWRSQMKTPISHHLQGQNG